MEWMLLPLKRYAEFGGRSRRQELWLFVLGSTILYLLLLVIALMLGIGAAGFSGAGSIAGMTGVFASMGILAIVFFVVWLGLLIPTLAVQVRRLHDTDRSGWWIMLYWGPVLLAWILALGSIGSGYSGSGLASISTIFSLLSWVGVLVLIVFYCLPGTVGPNQYGADPMGGASNLGETFS